MGLSGRKIVLFLGVLGLKGEISFFFSLMGEIGNLYVEVCSGRVFG